jgi:hypothetical protein
LSELKNVVFVHTQKTAGTSIINLLRTHYGYDNVISHADYIEADPERMDRIKVISGHFGFAFADRWMSSRYSFTFLRDPIERLLSLYSFCRSQQSDIYPIYAAARNSNLDVFLTAWRGLSGGDQLIYRETIQNHQTWQLCSGWSNDVLRPGRVSLCDFSKKELVGQAGEHLRKFDYVGLTDTFDADVSHIMEALGASLTLPPTKINVSENRLRLADLSTSTIALLEELTELDREVYEKAREMRTVRGTIGRVPPSGIAEREQAACEVRTS